MYNQPFDIQTLVWISVTYGLSLLAQADEMNLTPQMIRIHYYTTAKGDSAQLRFDVAAHKKASKGVDLSAITDLLRKCNRGDVVVVEGDPTFIGEFQNRQLLELAKACRLRNVTVRYISCDNVEEFSLLSWSAPFDNPRLGDETTYYLDGLKFGKGAEALNRALESARRHRGRTLILAGSDYTAKLSFGARELPFDSVKLRPIKKVYWAANKLGSAMDRFQIDQ